MAEPRAPQGIIPCLRYVSQPFGLVFKRPMATVRTEPNLGAPTTCRKAPLRQAATGGGWRLCRLEVRNEVFDVMRPTKLTVERTQIVGICANTVIFAATLLAGLAANSITIIASSFENLADSLTNILVFVGAIFARRPADNEHPFGHGRWEYLSALIVSVFIFFVGYEFLLRSINEIRSPSEISFDGWIILTLIITIAVKLWMLFFYQRVGNRLGSLSLLALGVDSRNDVIIRFSAISVILISHFTGLNVDGYMGVAIAGLILFSGFKVAKETISKLLGEGMDKERATEIQNFVSSYDGILDAHHLVVHSYGSTKVIASLHVDLPGDISLETAETITNKIEKDAKSQFNIELLLHAEPVTIGDKRLETVRDRVQSYLHLINPKIEANRFRVTEDNGKSNIEFELVFPHDFGADKEQMVITSVAALIESVDPNYNPIIDSSRTFVSE